MEGGRNLYCNRWDGVYVCSQVDIRTVLVVFSLRECVAMTGLKANGKAGSSPTPERVSTSMLMVRSTVEWKAEIEAFAAFDRATTISELIDRAVANYARHQAYDRPIPRRLGATK